MHYKKAIAVYQTTTNTTTPVMESIIVLLKEMSRLLENQTPDPETLAKIQDILFEIMSVTNRRTEEGQRLFLFYVHLNQLLVDVQLHNTYELIPQVRGHIDRLAEAWADAQLVQRQARLQSGNL